MSTIHWKFLITLLMLVLAVLRLFFPDIKIDAVTAFLLALALLPWLDTLLESIELPGGLKIKYRDVERVQETAESAGILNPVSQELPMRQHRYSFESIIDTDPKLALAGLRIEIESLLKKIAKSLDIPELRSLHKILQELKLREILTPKETQAIEEILPLLNRAAHGESGIDKRSAQLVIDIGKGILRSLESHSEGKAITQLLEDWQKRDGADTVEIGTELSKVFVKAPWAFLQAMRTNPASFTDWLEGLELHTFTVFEARDEVEDKLYKAFYEELGKLMREKANEALSSEYVTEATQILSKLNNIQIRLID